MRFGQIYQRETIVFKESLNGSTHIHLHRLIDYVRLTMLVQAAKDVDGDVAKSTAHNFLLLLIPSTILYAILPIVNSYYDSCI
jgi:hypothetical protein